jgi:type II secretory pathway pseudopilin PulG
VRAARPGFTIVDVLVSMAVVAILIGLLTPTMWSVRETARRVICGSNIRQLGIGIALFADDNRDRLPPSQFVNQKGNAEKPQEMLRLRVDKNVDGVSHSAWDGLGHLYHGGYLPEGHIFYCPSHAGANTFSNFAYQWREQIGSIMGNYQFRGSGPKATLFLSRIDPSSTALVADGLRTKADFNHKIGGNVLRADLSVFWFRDSAGRVVSALPAFEGEVDKDSTEEAWKMLDAAMAK